MFSLSFYKEALAGETNNYVHLRAAAEQKPVIEVLRELVDETVVSIRKIAELGAVQPGLAKVCNDYIMVRCYLYLWHLVFLTVPPHRVTSTPISLQSDIAWKT